MSRELMRLAAILAFFPSAATAATTITGAGATFPYPIYAKWAYLYNQKTGVRLNYQSIGSGGGIRQIKAGTVDFGASDAPLTAGELDKAGLMQFPMIMGGVVPVANLPGIGANQLVLSGGLLADIFMGTVTKWDDPLIAAMNPGLDLPGVPIAVVHRSDGSGTTWIFTNYLAKASKAFESKIGNGKAVAWPAGVGGKGNEGVANFVGKVPNSIGYVEYAYALQNKMASVKLKNRAGQPVAATAASFRAAASGADWSRAAGFYLVLTDQPGRDSWPITGASFILMRKEQQDPSKARAVLQFFDYAYREGGEAALSLDYVPMPEAVTELVRAAWKGLKGRGGKPVLP